MKFKYGDKVKMIIDLYKGKTGIVLGIDDICKEKNQYYVRYGSGSYEWAWFDENELELIPNELTDEEKTEAVFKKIAEVNNIEIGDEFNIKGFANNPLHFDGKAFFGNDDRLLIPKDIYLLVYCPSCIEKILPKKKMTHSQLVKELGYDFELIEEEEEK